MLLTFLEILDLIIEFLKFIKDKDQKTVLLPRIRKIYRSRAFRDWLRDHKNIGEERLPHDLR